jgi:FkbM family methyltransferase
MYSQQNEEALIIAAFYGKVRTEKPWRFLDVGAYHPTQFSNTRALYERGWSGVMIEPSPGPMRALLKEYGEDQRITLVQAAVASNECLVRMKITDDAISTSDPGVAETWKSVGGYFGSMLVPAITPAQISNQFGGFDFINLDAEGVSVDLFREMIALNWRPHCWCVEIDNRAAELAAIAEGAGYRSAEDRGFGVLGNGTNVVWVKK